MSGAEELFEAIGDLMELVSAIQAMKPAGEARDKARKAIERLEKKYESLERKNTKGAAEIRRKIQEARQAYNSAQMDICLGILKSITLPGGLPRALQPQ